jgi:cobalt-zinc-cadmium efflux system outer membrane protein
MALRSLPRRLLAAGLLFLAGCLYPVGEKIDLALCDVAMLPRDPLPAGAAVVAPPIPAQQKPAGKERWNVPSDLVPGGDVSPIQLPPKREKEAWTAAINELFPELGSLGEDPEPGPGPEGKPLALGDLQRLAAANNPAIKQAIAAVEAARGAAIQAGLYPNPTVGYEQDTANTTGGPGYLGGFVDQKIVTTNRLQTARAVAAMDLRNAEVALRRAQSDLATRVRGGYFAVLVARENVRINKALAAFTAQIFSIQVDQIKAGLSAAYEPMQLRALAYQARGALIQARNRYTSAWKQLASAMGLPGTPPAQLVGSVDMPVPVLVYGDVLARMLQRHTDVETAGNALLRSRYNLQLARVTPIPDVGVRTMLQKDYTGPPNNLNYSVAVGIPLPIWDRNQGGILQAQAQVVQASEEGNRVRVELTSRLAEAFERYRDSRALLRYYRDHILPDQVRVYRGVYERWNRVPATGQDLAGPGYTDVVVAQQNLAASIGTYVTTLGQSWQALVDVVDLLQTNDLFQTGAAETPSECFANALDLEQLLAPPHRPPCAPQPGRALPSSANWPPAMAKPATPTNARDK